MNLSGSLTNNNDFETENGFGINATDITNSATGNLITDGAGNLNATTSTVTNDGVISAGDNLSVTAATDITNSNVIASGNDLSLSAGSTIKNHNRRSRSLLFSLNDMELLSQDLINRQADIYSGGDLTVAGDSIGTASTSLTNSAGSIEAEGDIRITTQDLTNELTQTNPTMNCSDPSITVCSEPVFGASAYGIADGTLLSDTQTFGNIRLPLISNPNSVELTELAIANANILLDALALRATLIGGNDAVLNIGRLSNVGGTVSVANNLTIVGNDVENTTLIGLSPSESVYFYNVGPYFSISGFNVQAAHYFIDNPSAYIDNWNFLQSNHPDIAADMQALEDRINAMDLSDLAIANSDNYGMMLFPSTLEAGNTLSITATNQIANGIAAQGSSTPSTPPTFSLPTTTVSTSTEDSASLSTSQRNLNTASSDNPPNFAELANAIPPASFFVQVNVNTSLPTGNGLFTLSNGDDFIVASNATISQFIDDKGSDYLLEQLNYQPDTFTKRLGDGFYENYLIRQAIMAQTGRRFLHESLTSDRQQFRYLMDNAIAVQERLDLRVGVSLSDAQMAALTHDIVWLETRELAGQSVLVPTLYLATVREHELKRDGSILARNLVLKTKDLHNTRGLLADASAYIQVDERLTNNSNIVAKDWLQVTTQNFDNSDGLLQSADLSLIVNKGDVIRNSDSQIEASDSLIIQASGDITNEVKTEVSDTLQFIAGGDISNHGVDLNAGNLLTLQADGNVTINTTTETVRRGSSSNYRQTSTHTGSNLTSGGDIRLTAGEDLTLTGSNANAEGNITLLAEGNTLIQAAQDETYTYYKKTKKRSFGRKKTTIKESLRTTNVGGELTAGGNLTINSEVNEDAAQGCASVADAGCVGAAGSISTLSDAGSVTIVGAELTANNQLVASGDEVNVLALNEINESRSETRKRGAFGLSKSRTEKTLRESIARSSDVTTLEEDLSLLSAGDITIQGSNVIGAGDTELNSEGNILIESAENTTRETYEHESSRFGLSRSGFSVSIGKEKKSTDRVTETTTQQASTVGSLNGDVNVNSDGNVTIAASDILTQEGSITIEGEKVTFETRDDTFTLNEEQKQSFAGWTAGLSGGAVSTIQTIDNSVERIQETDNNTLKTLKLWQAGEALTGLENNINNLQHLGEDFKNPTEAAEGATSNINLNLSLGSSSSKSSTEIAKTTAVGSSVMANDNLTITSRNNIEGQGTLLQADTLNLNADNEIILTSAENTSRNNQENESSSSSIGISIGSNGLQVTAAASESEGFTYRSDDQYLESVVQANQTTIHSGSDTTLEGAQIQADQVTATIGGDLIIRSQQDQSNFEQENSSSGFNAAIGIGGPSSLTVNASELEAQANYQSTQQLSGIFAGEDGFDIRTEGNTVLQAGVIASTAGEENNTLNTNQIIVEDNLQNESSYSVTASSIGLNLGTGQPTSGSSVVDTNNIPLTGWQAHSSDNQRSTTQSVISPATIIERDGETGNLENVLTSTDDNSAPLDNLTTLVQDEITDAQEEVEIATILQEEVYQYQDEIGEAIKTTIEAVKDTKLYQEAQIAVAQLTNNLNKISEDSAESVFENPQQALNELIASGIRSGEFGANEAMAILSDPNTIVLMDELNYLSEDNTFLTQNPEANNQSDNTIVVNGENIPLNPNSDNETLQLLRLANNVQQSLDNIAEDLGVSPETVGKVLVYTTLLATGRAPEIIYNEITERVLGDTIGTVIQQGAESIAAAGHGTDIDTIQGITDDNFVANAPDGKEQLHQELAAAVEGSVIGAQLLASLALGGIPGKGKGGNDRVEGNASSPENNVSGNNTANPGTQAGATDGEMIAQPPANPSTGSFSATHNSTLTNGGINPDKFNYLFGKSTSNSHNSARSNQLALEMERLGVVDNVNGRSVLNQHFDNTVRQEGNVMRNYQNDHGSFEVRESLLIGPSGKAVRLESTFEVMSDGSRRFITTIPTRSGD